MSSSLERWKTIWIGPPLDLAAINIARGRDTGVAPLNLVRNQLFAQSGEAQLKAYTSWVDFGGMLKHPKSLVNFIASYGTHASITAATSNAAKVAAAQALVTNGDSEAQRSAWMPTTS